MKSRQSKTDSNLDLIRKADAALRKAVADVVREHKRRGESLTVWRDGKVVEIPPEELVVREPSVEYRKRKR
ncbi:MAG: hypothetical protein FJ279_11785 [Planctomycetes bacterium]|nr:hypothetical protein [Planctomycetota bacterium]